MPGRRDKIPPEEVVRRFNGMLVKDDCRCSYCGSIVYMTYNHNQYYNFVCPECGALSATNGNPTTLYYNLKYKGVILDRLRREYLRHSENGVSSTL